MNTATRKQQEIKDRERRILDVARGMLGQEGYHGLSMDRIAEQLQYSKGTIYNHFDCKEEIIIALAIDTSEKMLKMFQQASAFRGESRERMSAIGAAFELFVRSYPYHFRCEQILRSDSIWQKTSEKRQAVMRASELRCTGVVAGIIRDGVARGDLELPEEVSPEEMVFGLWSMTYGAYSIIATSQDLQEIGIREPFSLVRRHIHTLLDGYGWRPLRSEHDYDAVLRRIAAEVFPEEAHQLDL